MNNPLRVISNLTKNISFPSINLRKIFNPRNIWDNKRYIFGGCAFGGFVYYFYYQFKLNNSVNIRIFPPCPSTGIINDFEQVKYLTEHFENDFIGKKGLGTLCIYGKLGCGKSTLAKQFCEDLIDKKTKWYSIPKSKTIAFVDCSSQDSFLCSLMDICTKISQVSGRDNHFDVFSDIIINKSFDEKVESYFLYISEMLKQHPGWILVFDNINEFSYNNLRQHFQTYVFGDLFKTNKGSVLLVCDTEDASFLGIPSSYLMHGLSYDAALQLLSKYSLISSDIISQEDLNKILPLIHSQPLSVISFGLLVKENLEHSSHSISTAFKNVEDSVNNRIKRNTTENNVSITPRNFEAYFLHTLVQMVLEKLDQNCDGKTIIKLLSTISLLSPFAAAPETLLSRFFVAYGDYSSLSTIDDHSKIKLEKLIDTPNPTFYQRVINQYKIAKNAYLEAKQAILDAQRFNKTLDLIRPEEKLAHKLKDNPFINIFQGEFQDYFQMHPIIYEEIRLKLFKDSWNLFKDPKTTVEKSGFGFFFNLFNLKQTAINDTLPKAWDLLNSKHSSFNENSRIAITETDFDKLETIKTIQKKLQICLSQSENIRYPEREKLTLLRAQHLQSVINEFRQSHVEGNFINGELLLKPTINDQMYISSLENSLSSAYNDLNMFNIAETTSKSLMKNINEQLPNGLKTPMKEEIIRCLLNLSESLIAQNKTEEVYPYLSKLWSIIAPNELNIYPYYSSKLLRLVVKYNKLAPKKLTDLDELSLLCHAIQRLNLSIMNSTKANLTDETLGIELMKIQMLYAHYLMAYGYLDYADYIISESEKFNLDILKAGKDSVPSPFDKAIAKLELSLNTFKGDFSYVLSTLRKAN